MKTRLHALIFSYGLTAFSITFADTPSERGDTSIVKEKESLIHWRLTARLHSKGIFTYGGQLATDNPAFDANFTIEYKKWGLLIYKGIDLSDHNTDYNFSLLAVFRNFKLADKVTFTPYVGSILEQFNTFADTGSDVVCILITSVKIKPHITLEHMGMFGNLVFEPSYMDWVNRFRLTYASKHLDVIASLWHNNQVFDKTNYVTTGLNVAYSRMKIGKHIFLSTGVTGLATLHTSDGNENPSENRLMATLAAQWAQ